MLLYQTPTDDIQAAQAPRQLPDPATSTRLLRPAFTRAELREIVLELMG